MRASPDQRSDDLSEALLALASLPDDSAALPVHLGTIVRLSASVSTRIDAGVVTGEGPTVREHGRPFAGWPRVSCPRACARRHGPGR